LNIAEFVKLSQIKGKIILLALLLGLAPLLQASESVTVAPELFHVL
jgi:hypothetical protein